jgi:hypothetical protein
MLGIFDNLCPPNSLYTFYDDLKKNINKLKDVELTHIKVHNFTPIMYNQTKFLLTSLLGLEHLFLNKNNKIMIKYFIDDKTFGEIILKKHLDLLNIKNFNIDLLSEYDSFYDEHSQLLFIKFQDICIEYFDISVFNLTRLMNTSFSEQKIIISFLDNYINKLDINSNILSDYTFIEKNFTLPSLPYLTIKVNDLIPYKGSSVVNYNNELIGIVNNSNPDNIINITPLLSIIRSLKYLEGKNSKLLLIGFDFVVKSIENKNVLKITKLITENPKNKNLNIYITSIDDYLISDDGNIIYNGRNIPLNTYIWLNMDNKIDNKIDITYFKYVNDMKVNKTKSIYLKKWDKISNISLSKLNYFNTKNTFIFELNEKILSIIINYLAGDIDYRNILTKIYDNRFSIKRKKILLFVKLKKNNHHFELIEDYDSIADINEKLNISKSLEIKLSNDTIKLVKN